MLMFDHFLIEIMYMYVCFVASVDIQAYLYFTFQIIFSVTKTAVHYSDTLILTLAHTYTCIYK